MKFPQNLKYSKEHTWLLLEGDTGTVGITEFAQSELGEIVYVDLQTLVKLLRRMKFLVLLKQLKQHQICLCR